MGKVVGNLTQGELVQVFGRTMEEVGKRMHAGEFVDGIQMSEVLTLLQQFATDLYGEYQDED